MTTKRTRESFRVAAVQASSVYLDRERSIEKACRLIDEAGKSGGDLVVFPEAFVPKRETPRSPLPSPSTNAIPKRAA
jgi:predicted amidohydrolase